MKIKYIYECTVSDKLKDMWCYLHIDKLTREGETFYESVGVSVSIKASSC